MNKRNQSKNDSLLVVDTSRNNFVCQNTHRSIHQSHQSINQTPSSALTSPSTNKQQHNRIRERTDHQQPPTQFHLSLILHNTHTQNQFHDFLGKIEASRPSKSYNHYINSVSHIHIMSQNSSINKYNTVQS